MGVETAMTAGSLLASGVGAGMSFAQAKKQKELMNEAQRQAEQAMSAAKLKLGVNYYEQLAVPMQAYEKEREALISQGAQAMQAGVESERGAAATAGRIQMAQTEAQAGQRAAMAKELSDLAKLTATEESRLAGLRADLDISEATAARLKERDAQRARAAYMMKGMESVTSGIKTAAPLIDLYLGKKDEIDLTDLTNLQMIGGKTTKDISLMNQDELSKFIKGLSPEDKDKWEQYLRQTNVGPTE